MSCFLYYLSGVQGSVHAARLRALGLRYAVAAGGTVACVVVLRGPDGEPGVVVADPKRMGDAAIGYYATQQTWRRIPAECLPGSQGEEVTRSQGGIYAGFYTATPPGPEDLLRADHLRGELVILADDRPWIVPVLRGIVADPRDPDADPVLVAAVPTVAGVDESGHWQAGRVAPHYREAWEAALRWSRAKAAIEFEVGPDSQGQGQGQGDAIGILDFDGILDAAATVLACNYVVSKIEIDMLGLFTTHTPRNVLDAAIDWKALSDWLKKKLSANPAGGASSAGCADSTPITDPPAANG